MSAVIAFSCGAAAQNPKPKPKEVPADVSQKIHGTVLIRNNDGTVRPAQFVTVYIYMPTGEKPKDPMDAWQSIEKEEALRHHSQDGKFWFEPGDKAELPDHGNVFYKLLPHSPSCDSVLLEAPAAVIAIGLASKNPSSMTEAEKRDRVLQPGLELWTRSVTDKDGNFENDIGFPGSKQECVRSEGCDSSYLDHRRYKKGETMIRAPSNFFGKFLFVVFLDTEKNHYLWQDEVTVKEGEKTQIVFADPIVCDFNRPVASQ